MKTLPLGEKIKQVRTSKDLTQAFLAHVVNCSSNHISRIEKCEVECDTETLTLIKKALEIPKAPLTEDELKVYKRQTWVWHEQINSGRTNDAEAMKNELADILQLPFEYNLIVIYLMLEARMLIKPGTFDKASQNISKAEAIIEKMGDAVSVEAMFLYHRNKGNLLAHQNDYKKSVMHRLKAVDFNIESLTLKPDAQLFRDISQSYLNIGQPHNALLYSERALAADNNDPTLVIAPSIGIIQASVYTALGQFDKAKAMYKEILERAKSINNKKAIGICIMDLGGLELKAGNPEEALKLIIQGMEIFEEDGQPTIPLYNCTFLYVKAKCLMQLKQIDECEKIIDEGMRIATDAGLESFIICFNSARCLMNLKDPKSQEYLENIAIPHCRDSNTVLIYEALEICHTLEKFYYKNRSKTKGLNMAKVSRDILHEMFYGYPIEL